MDPRPRSEADTGGGRRGQVEGERRREKPAAAEIAGVPQATAGRSTPQTGALTKPAETRRAGHLTARVLLGVALPRGGRGLSRPFKYPGGPRFFLSSRLFFRPLLLPRWSRLVVLTSCISSILVLRTSWALRQPFPASKRCAPSSLMEWVPAAITTM